MAEVCIDHGPVHGWRRKSPTLLTRVTRACELIEIDTTGTGGYRWRRESGHAGYSSTVREAMRAVKESLLDGD